MYQNRELEVEIGLLKEKFHAAAAAQEEFLNLAAHDLNAPLRKLSSFTDLLINQIPGTQDPKIIKYQQKIHHCVNQMRDMIDRLALLAEVAFLSPPIVDCDLNKIVLQVSGEVSPLHPESGITVVAGSLPIIEGNYKQFRQLFLELITNSFSYSKKNSASSIRIDAQVLPQEELLLLPGNFLKQLYYKIVVSDSGIGIPGDAIKKLFSPFHRGHGPSGTDGYGLGLAICKKIVNNHHGIIYATSNEKITELIMILAEKQTYPC